MTGRRDLDLLLRSHFEATADRSVADGQVDSILALTAGHRQEPAWLASLRSHAMFTTARSLSHALPARSWAVLLVLALVLALVAAVAIGGPRPAPPPLVNGPIVFGRFDPTIGDTVIYIARPDGTDAHMVRSGANQCPKFSPDGRRLAVGSGTLDIADGTLTRFADPVSVAGSTVTLGCSTWSPDGRRLAAEGWNDSDTTLNGIFLVDADDGGGAVRLTTNGQGGTDLPGDFSPDGSQVAFVRGEAGQDAGTIWVVDLDDGATRQVIPDKVGGDVSWSPDGEWLVAGRELVPFTETKFILVRPDGSDLRTIDLPPIHNWANPPRFSPDGTRLVFDMAIGISDNADIYTMTIDGTDLIQVTDTPNVNEHFVDWGVDPT